MDINVLVKVAISKTEVLENPQRVKIKACLELG
jgi:hypothetical protein